MRDTELSSGCCPQGIGNFWSSQANKIVSPMTVLSLVDIMSRKGVRRISDPPQIGKEGEVEMSKETCLSFCKSFSKLAIISLSSLSPYSNPPFNEMNLLLDTVS